MCPYFSFSEPHRLQAASGGVPARQNGGASRRVCRLFTDGRCSALSGPCQRQVGSSGMVVYIFCLVGWCGVVNISTHKTVIDANGRLLTSVP